MKKLFALSFLALSSSLFTLCSAQFTTLLNFNDTNGNEPYGSLLLSGNALYGMTEYGGIYNGGNVFSVDTNGNNVTNQHSFYNGSETGESPYYTNLVVSGNKMYGMTEYGGIYGTGNIFSIDTNGGGYKDLWDFDGGGDTNGTNPEGSLTLVGGKLYGMTSNGGVDYAGNVFRIDTTGSGYKDMWDFSFGGTNGEYPDGSLTLSGGKFYGMTNGGGVYGSGSVFTIDTTGNNYKDLQDFEYYDGGNGAYPQGDVTIAGGNLYGMTSDGGVNQYGNVFTLDTNGDNYVDLWDFAYNNGGNGTYPQGDVTIVGNKLYGMTNEGGVNRAGNIFSIDTNYAPASYIDMFDFNYTLNGGYPQGNLTLSANKLYGMTEEGGLNYSGTIFSIDTNGNNVNTLYNLGSTSTDGKESESSLTLDGNKLYGMTNYGGQYYRGTILSIDTDGGNYVERYSFGGGSSSGKEPIGDLIRVGNKLYGMSSEGGAYLEGNIFSMDTNLGNYKNLWSFDNGGDSNGSYPEGNLTLVGGKFYGMTEDGGYDYDGNIFSIDTNGSGYKDLFDFDYNPNGEDPEGSLTLGGGKLFGMTNYGGAGPYPNYGGTIFSIDTTGNNFKTIWGFDYGGDTNGSEPQYGNLLLSGHLLYGMTEEGGLLYRGNIFKIDTNGSGYKNLWIFDNGGDTNGAYPQGSLILAGGNLYGMTEDGGENGQGNIFSVDTLGDSSSYKDLVDFNYANGYEPQGSLVLSQGSLYGMTYRGGSNGDGVVFRMNLVGIANVTDTSVSTCFGDNTGHATAYVSGVTAPYTYSWSPSPSTTDKATGLVGGIYTLTVTNPEDISVTAAVTITSPAAISAVVDSTDVNGSTLGSVSLTPSGGTVPYTYLWSANANSQTTASISGLSVGTYTCTITDNHNCDDIVSVNITNVTGINNITNSSSAISIYPNPSEGMFTIQSSVVSSQSSVVEVYNMIGQQVMNQPITGTTNELDLSNQPAGIYMYRVLTQTGSLIGDGKLIIQQ